jgi:signal peptidase I
VIRHSTGTGARDSGRWYLSVFGNVILWIIIGVDAWFLWPSSLGGGTTLIVVRGSSMEPTLHPGDLVVARRGMASVGDIVVYEPTDFEGSQIVHRIVGGNGVDGWEIQGDNNSWLDQWQPTDSQVVGRVVLRFSGGGRLADFLITPWVWGFVLIGAIALMLWPDREADDESDGPKTPLRAAENSRGDATNVGTVGW